MLSQSDPTLVDPTNQNTPELFARLNINNVIVPYGYKQILINKKLTIKGFEQVLFLMTKDERQSKDGRTKPAGQFICVFDPTPIGSGSFGGVYPVIGMWKQVGDDWVWKTKAPGKERLVKTNALDRDLKEGYQAVTNYVNEQAIGSQVPHMGMKYQPTICGDTAFLLMNKQPGISLKELLEQTKSNPLTPTIRLLLTINLLEALRQQISKLKAANGGYIVHRDLKPANIIVNPEDWSVKIVDYGLAAASTDLKPSKSYVGTLEYNDPQLLEHLNPATADKSSDFSSMARVIAELWGDKSRRLFVTREHARLRKNSNLFDDLTSLDKTTLEALETVINSITAFHKKDRITRQRALAKLRSIMRKIDRMNETKASNKPLAELSVDELMELFQGRHAEVLSNRFSDNQTECSAALAKLGFKVAALNDQCLDALKKSGFEFSTLTLNLNAINHYNLTGSRIKKLMQLGVKLNPLTFTDLFVKSDNLNRDMSWLEKCSLKQWTEICRVIYENTAESDRDLTAIPYQNNFSSIFCHHFLANKELAAKDNENIVRINQHIKIATYDDALIRQIQYAIKTNYPDCPLAKAMLASHEFNPPVNQLRLEYSTELHTIQQIVLNRAELFAKYKKLKEDLEMPNRTKVIAEITNKIGVTKKSSPVDWYMIHQETKTLEPEIEHISKLDKIRRKIVSEISVPAARSTLLKQLDTFYARAVTENEWYELKTNISSHIKTYYFIQKRLYANRQLTLNKVGIPPQVKVEQDYAAIISEPDILQSQAFKTAILKYESFYTEWNKTYLNLRSINGLAPKRALLFTSIQKSLWDNSDTLTRVPAHNRLRAVNEFFANEHQLRSNLLLSLKPKAMDFLYQLLVTKFVASMQAPEGTIDKALTEFNQLLYCINAQGIFFKTFLEQLEGILNTQESDPENLFFAEKLEQCNQLLWPYITQSKGPLSKEKILIHNKLSAILNEMKRVTESPERNRYEFYATSNSIGATKAQNDRTDNNQATVN